MFHVLPATDLMHSPSFTPEKLLAGTKKKYISMAGIDKDKCNTCGSLIKPLAHRTAKKQEDVPSVT